MAAADGGVASKALTFAMPFLNALRLVRLPFVFSIVKVSPVQQLSEGVCALICGNPLTGETSLCDSVQ